MWQRRHCSSAFGKPVALEMTLQVVTIGLVSHWCCPFSDLRHRREALAPNSKALCCGAVWAPSCMEKSQLCFESRGFQHALTEALWIILRMGMDFLLAFISHMFSISLKNVFLGEKKILLDFRLDFAEAQWWVVINCAVLREGNSFE